MSNLNLHIDNGDELFAPVAILHPRFTPAEVAALLIFVAMEGGRMEEANIYLLAHDLKAASKRLQEIGVITLSAVGSTLKIYIDLEAGLPEATP